MSINQLSRNGSLHEQLITRNCSHVSGGHLSHEIVEKGKLYDERMEEWDTVMEGFETFYKLKRYWLYPRVS